MSLSVDQIIGTLRVVEYDVVRKLWTAVCQVCGKQIQAKSSRLKRRKGCVNRACGGQRKKLEGLTYGRWKVERYLGSNASGKSMYECVCACGKTPPRPVQASNLTAKLTKSCGCWQAERMSYVGKRQAPPEDPTE